MRKSGTDSDQRLGQFGEEKCASFRILLVPNSNDPSTSRTHLIAGASGVKCCFEFTIEIIRSQKVKYSF